MAIRLDIYYEENKNLSIEELEAKCDELEKWLSSDERKEFERDQLSKPVFERIDVDNPIEIAKSELKVLRTLIHDKSVGDGSPYLDYFKEINKNEGKDMDDFIDNINSFIEEGESQNNQKQRVLKCPNCSNDLMFLEPSSVLFCRNCNKYYETDYHSVGKEIDNPLNDKDVLY